MWLATLASVPWKGSPCLVFTAHPVWVAGASPEFGHCVSARGSLIRRGMILCLHVTRQEGKGSVHQVRVEPVPLTSARGTGQHKAETHGGSMLALQSQVRQDNDYVPR